MNQVFLHRYDEQFLGFIAARELRIPVHAETGKALGLHQRAWCAAGDAAVRWMPASGRGTVLSFTVTRRPYKTDFAVPLLHGLIELAEGPTLICRIGGMAPEDAAEGLEVEADFDAHGLLFRPIGGAGDKQ